MSTTDLTDAQAEKLATIEAAPPAPESDDQDLWGVLYDLIPCAEFGDCGDECECAEGELRLAVQRLIVAERVHHADCEGYLCCDATVRRTRLVNQAVAIRVVTEDARR